MSCCLPQANIVNISFFSQQGKEKFRTETMLDFISFILYDDQILRLDEKNWQWLWCNTRFQGISATQDFSEVLGKKGMHIKSFYVPKEKAHTTRYQEINHYKHTQKGVLIDYSENTKAPITILQNKSSAAIKLTIHRSSKIITS